MSSFVMSDIHGDKKRFFEMLKKIKFNSKDTLYIIGDILDRGDGSFEIYDYIMKQKNIHFLLGNHEVALLNVNRCIEKEKWEELKLWKSYWFEGHGEETYTMFFGEWEQEQRNKYLDFLKKCNIDLLIKVGKKYHYLVHAGIANDVFEKVQNRRIMQDLVNGKYDVLVRELKGGYYETSIGLLTKEEKLKAKEDGWIINPTIWFGHTPTIYQQSGIPRIWKKENFRNIDCGCCGYSNRGRLCCVNLQTEEEFYIE